LFSIAAVVVYHARETALAALIRSSPARRTSAGPPPTASLKSVARAADLVVDTKATPSAEWPGAQARGQVPVATSPVTTGMYPGEELVLVLD
jgi:hypothetical protein